jgi:alpha-maltose-1-phosphate synthase
MRILLIQFTGAGGIQVYTAGLANALAEKHEVYVMTGEYLADRKYYDENVHLVPVKASASGPGMLLTTMSPLTYIGLARKIKKIKPDIIHVTYEFLWDAFVLSLLRQYPVVYTLHDPAFHTEKFSIRGLVARSYLGISKRIELKRADAVIVHGKAMREVLKRQGGEEKKIKVLPLGDFSIYRKWETPGLSEAPDTVLFFGRICNYKGIEHLIKAGPLISAAVPGVRIVLAGAGDFTPYRPLIESSGLFEVINRHIPDEEVAGLFQRSCVVVLPYIDGSQTGIVPIAYSFKKPVVVTDVGSLGEVVDDGRTGFLVPPASPEALADAIVRLLRDEKLRRQLGESGYEKLAGELSWDKIGKDISGIYRAITGR